jgi:hypothetical protein
MGMFMILDRSASNRRGDVDFGPVKVTNADRTVPHSLDLDRPSARGRSWSVFLLILCAYFAPALTILLPWPNATISLIAVSIVALGAALFAFICLDRNEPHRTRLMIVGSGVGLTFLYFVIKPMVGL